MIVTVNDVLLRIDLKLESGKSHQIRGRLKKGNLSVEESLEAGMLYS